MRAHVNVFLAQVEGLLKKRPKVQGGQVYISNDLNKVLIYAENEAKAMGDDSRKYPDDIADFRVPSDNRVKLLRARPLHQVNRIFLKRAVSSR